MIQNLPINAMALVQIMDGVLDEQMVRGFAVALASALNHRCGRPAGLATSSGAGRTRGRKDLGKKGTPRRKTMDTVTLGKVV